MKDVKVGSRKDNVWYALLTVVISLAIVLWGGIILDVGYLIPLLTAAGVASVIGLWMGYSWSDIEKGILGTINRAMLAGVILLLVGILIGTWIISGTIPFLIFWGLEILTPKTFLVGTFVFCSLFSLATGTSFGTIGTAGVALLAVGEVLGYPAGITVGAVLSGAYLGDKMSPVSDTTNVAAAITDTNLFKHISSMMYTTFPAGIVVLIIYIIMSLSIGSGSMPSDVAAVQAGLTEHFNLNIVTLIPPIVLIILAAWIRMPAIPILAITIAVSAILALLTQGIGFTQLISVATAGYVPETGIELIDGLLSNGGIESMFFTVVLMLCALILGGVLEGANILQTIINAFINKVKSIGGLIGSVLASAYLMLAGTGNVFVAIILPARGFSDVFKKKGIQSRVLSRTIEDAATLGGALIPWSLAAVFTAGVLQISPLEFIPYFFLGWIVPIFAIIYGITGFAIFKDEDNGKNIEGSEKGIEQQM